MKAFTRRFNGIELMKYIVLYSSILVFFAGLTAQEVPQVAHYEGFSYSVSSDQCAFEKTHDPASCSFCKIVGDSEIEEEEDGDSPYANEKVSRPLSLSLVLTEITKGSFLSPRKTIKLFILFHSWKLFLL